MTVLCRFAEYNSLMLTADHMSNAGLCAKDEGLSDIGVRYGFKRPGADRQC